MINIVRVLLTIAAIQYGFFPLAADLGESHVFNPDWPPHARLHTVWLLGIGSGIGAYVIFLTWGPSKDRIRQLWHASILGIIVLAAFFVAAVTSSSYGGALSDPVHEILIAGINANLFAFSIAAIFQISAMIILWTNSSND